MYATGIHAHQRIQVYVHPFATVQIIVIPDGSEMLEYISDLNVSLYVICKVKWMRAVTGITN